MDLMNLARLTHARTKRTSSYDRSGGNDDWVTIGPGETFVLLDTNGPGKITHIWTTLLSEKDKNIRKNLILRMFWDGQEHPSVECPIGDFFGQGWGLNYNFSSLLISSAPRDGTALVSYIPMPFSTHARIEVLNMGLEPCDRFYFYVDYELVDIDPDLGRFHAWYNQETTSNESSDGMENAWISGAPDPKNCSDKHNYLFCDAEGTGHFVGVNYYVQAPSAPWPGEGDDMFRIDGEPWPGLHGTGTEDYFNTSWGPDEHFTNPLFGIAYAPGKNNSDPQYGWMGRMHYYRFHFFDPVRFQSSLRASIEHGHANGMILHLSSVAYWYQTLPSKPFPPLPQDRTPLPLTTVEEIHAWRHAYLKEKGLLPKT